MTELKWIWPVIVSGDSPEIISSPAFTHQIKRGLSASVLLASPSYHRLHCPIPHILSIQVHNAIHGSLPTRVMCQKVAPWHDSLEVELFTGKFKIFSFSTWNYADQVKPDDSTYTDRNIVHGCLLGNSRYEALLNNPPPTPPPPPPPLLYDLISAKRLEIKERNHC